ncbi:MAG: 30S ribosomal protein S7 [Candidatus Levyibacteriota bacterium]|nr:MAG: 30S ribosomal protein S7 [Candidatus Levybacteria bacterium]
MRHKKVVKRETNTDPVYNSKLVAKFINNIMIAGKKTAAQKTFYNALVILESKGQVPLEAFEKAIQTVGPRVEVKARRVGGANYQVPAEVRGERKTSLAIRWIIDAAKARPSAQFHTFAEKLAAELLDVLQNQGAAIKKRDTVLRMAEANKAFAHFRW